MISKERFTEIIEGMGYNISTVHRLLGISRSTAYRISRGTSEVPEVAVRLLDMYARRGIPEEHKL